MKLSLLAAILLAALALAACGGSQPPPTASQLAHKIPGCHHFVTQTPSALAKAEVTCDAPGSGPLGSIEVATFASMGKEVKWITRQGSQATCCVEGHLWAAEYYLGANQFPRIMKALGGRQVNG
jgi:hypothetical protein